MPLVADPFGTAALRDAVLAAWRDSPTRAAEDLAVERDLVTVGYRDRVPVELAQNAADAAAAAGVPGELAVWLDADGVHVANTGAPLTVDGVRSLSALRVSPKSDGAAVGRFGVGFAAVLTVTDHVQIRSTAGGIEFSADRSRADAGAPAVATMRLPYPCAVPPREGFATEVVLFGAGTELVAEFAAEAGDLLLDLPALTGITVAGERITAPDLPTGTGPHARWVRGADARFLHSPTRTDEPLTLPVRVIADLPTTPDRRHLHPDAEIARAAQGYAEFVAAQADPMDLLPPRRPPAGAVDGALRAAIEEQLRSYPWLPGGLRPDRAAVLPGLTDELYRLLCESLPMVPPELSAAPDAARLEALGARGLTAADLADAVPRDREPAWYAELYAALDAARLPADELGALPVPLADGRVVTGARGATVVADRADPATLARIGWARVVHPEAAHPLLDRVGARRATTADLLADPALRAEVDRIDWESGATDDDLALTEAVLACAGETGAVGPAWLGALPVPDTAGELVPADELLTADAPLRAVLGDDHPYGTVDPEFAARYPAAALRAIGVGWTFGVLREEYPEGPDSTLDGAEDWWAALGSEPDELIAVRDLDLVEHWEPALSLIADLPGVLDDPDGYTAWWLRTRTPLGRLRSLDDPTFAGLLDPCEHPDAGRLRSALFAGVRSDSDAQTMADALADPQRTPAPGVIAAAYRALAGRHIEDLPARVRTADGELVPAEAVTVLDRPHLRFLGTPIVFGGIEEAAALAATLDLPRTGEVHTAAVMGRGARFARGAHPGVTLAQLLGALPEAPETEVHERLTVRTDLGEHAVPHWVDDAGVLHVDAAEAGER
ncbi:molecular chaperone Hsp90 [Tsukamurella sp. TY48]|uniref:sacsin N-terminal ATP-binding-like domain-containing protein n=1 Tax=Tsukamurella sp. TY48 TaxID=2775495 RepID=UPI001C7D8FEB|nr:ATP-binding protein [Tsukamurella sp. TY48]GIZ96412.1 molecular chaperone Hsp90 [Tsukamurella sp. TY48]